MSLKGGGLSEEEVGKQVLKSREGEAYEERGW